jgi:atypical dual specificity phosphatase
MVKIGNIYRWMHGRILGKPTNFSWIIKRKLAGSGVPMSLSEVKWLVKQGIRSIVTIKDKPLPTEWFSNDNTKIDNFHISIQDYGAPSLQELDYVVNHITQQINRGRPVVVHCSGGKGRTGTIIAAYLVKKGSSADQAIKRLRKMRGESIQSKDQESIVLSYERYLETDRTKYNGSIN